MRAPCFNIALLLVLPPVSAVIPGLPIILSAAAYLAPKPDEAVAEVRLFNCGGYYLGYPERAAGCDGALLDRAFEAAASQAD